MSIHKLPPQNIEAEMCVLGACFLDNEAINKSMEILVTEDFYRDSHRKIFESMLKLNNNAEPVDLVTITDALKKSGHLDKVGGSSYLSELTDFVPTAANVKYYCRLVKDHAINREVITRCNNVSEKAFDPAADPQELLEEAQKSFFQMTLSNKKENGLMAVNDSLPGVFEKIQGLYERNELITGVPTGFHELDMKTAGFQPEDLIIIAGRPSMGKTALVLNLIENSTCRKASDSPSPAAIFSLEMGRESLIQRLLCSIGHIDANRLRTGRLHETDWPRLTEAAGVLSSAPIFIDDTPGISITELRAKARRMKAEHDLGLIVIDYLQLMAGDKSENRQNEISDISRGLKGLAKELKVPVVALSQLNRSLEQRNDKRPIMSDLRESGAIEQDADVIMFVYRDAVYCDACKKREPCDKGHEEDAELIIGKQRNGPIGTVKLHFKGQFTRFQDPPNVEKSTF